MIPTRLEEWTLDAVRHLAESGTTENDRFDLKHDLQDAEGQRKVVAAFANSGGGFLVFGVTDDRRVVGVSSRELPRDFGTKLRKGLTPSVDCAFRVPFEIEGGRKVFVAEVPDSERRPHAVWLKDSWIFYKRTSSGNNDPMTFEEIRGAFLDAGRRESELAWLQAEVTRIRDLAAQMNVELSGRGRTLDVLLSRFDPVQLRTLLVSVFGYLDPTVVPEMHLLIERCTKVDAVLAPMAAFAMRPRDRSYTQSGPDPLETVRHHLPQIVKLADQIGSRLTKAPA